MRVLVTGVKGQLGYDVCRHLASRGVEHKGVDIDDFDLTDEKATFKAINDYASDCVVHCAAWTAVDKAEECEDKCRLINRDGTRHVALACKALNSKMVYISTDYVFDGEGDKPYEIDAPIAPKSVYGQTKAEGEGEVKSLVPRHFIVRTSWVFGKNGHNFINTMLRLGNDRPEIKVVSDQVGSPTYTYDLAMLLCDMITTDKYGTYHATNEGFCSWAEFAQAIMQQAGLNCKVLPIPTSEYPTAAKRPLNSRLSKLSLDEAGFNRLPSWEDALGRYLKEKGIEVKT